MQQTKHERSRETHYCLHEVDLSSSARRLPQRDPIAKPQRSSVVGKHCIANPRDAGPTVGQEFLEIKTTQWHGSGEVPGESEGVTK